MSKRVQYALSVPSLPVAPNTEADRVLIYAKGGGFYYRRPDGAEVGPLASQAEAAAVPSNMVTTDTDQTITGLKTFNNELHAINSRPIGTWGGGPFDEDKAHAYIYPSMLQIGSRMATAVDHPSGSSTTADIIFYGHRWDPDRNAGAGGDQRDIGNIWFQYAPELSDFRFEVSHALEVPQLYEGINRVLTTASTLPAPSNMVTTDTDQELSAGKTFGPTAPTGWAGSQPLRFRSRSLDNPANPTLFDVTLAADYNFHFTQSNPDAFFAFNTSGGYNAGQISLNPASGDVHLAAPRASADNPDSTASIRLVPSTWTGGGSQSHEVFLGARATLLDGTPGSLLVLQPQQTQVIGELYEGTNRVYSVNNLPPAPSNMVTTDTAQTISGAKTFLDHTYFSGSTSAADLFVRDPSGPPWSQQTYIGQSYIQLMDNGSKTETTIYPDAGLLLKGPPATATGPAPWGPYVGARPQFWNGTSSQAVNAGFEWTATSTTTALVTATRSAFRADGAIYEGTNRVYSAANLPPAPSNMMTTDTEQTITEFKEFSVGLSAGSDGAKTYLNSGSIEMSALTPSPGGQAQATLRLISKQRAEDGTLTTYAAELQEAFGQLRSTVPLYEGENRVYSAGNKVPASGLSATGTASSTTFLRGDNTWASVTAAAPSNMVTTDTWQEITGAKRFAGGPQTAVASFSPTSWPSVNNTSVNSPALQFSPISLNNDVETSHNIMLFGLVNGDGTRARLYTTGQLEATELWEDSNRVYSANNKVPSTGLSATGTASSATFLRGDNTWATPSAAAPSNMVTTDTSQTISGEKYFYSSSDTGEPLVILGGSSVTRRTPFLTFYVPVTSQATATVSLQGAADDSSGTNRRLEVRFGGLTAEQKIVATNGGVWENASRVYSVNNKVPASGMSATGTASSTTFLRGDNTWATPSAVAPSNMMTTDTAQTITGTKTFGVANLEVHDGTNLRFSVGSKTRVLSTNTAPLGLERIGTASPGTPALGTGIDFTTVIWDGSASTNVTWGGLTASHRSASASDKLITAQASLEVLGDSASTGPALTVYNQTAAQNIVRFLGTGGTSRLTLTDAGVLNVSSQVQENGSRVYSPNNAPPAPSNMVTTDTAQTITAKKRIQVASGADGLDLNMSDFPTSDGQSFASPQLTGQVAYRAGGAVTIARAYLQAVIDSNGANLRWQTVEQIRAGQLYDNGQRVYSVNNKVPASGLSATGTASSTTFLRGDNTWATPAAPSNMVTTDTTQTLTGDKTWTHDGTVLTLMRATSASAGATLLNSPTLRFRPSYWNGSSVTNPAVSLWASAEDTSGTVALRTSARFYAQGGLYDGAEDTSRVYSVNNKVPASGMSATGTADSTTFLRGDNTWAAPPAGISPTLVDAKGDLIVGTANDAVARQPVGTDGHVLVADTTSATGVKWASPSALSTGAGYATIQDEGTSQAQRATLNFIGATVTAADDLVNLRTNVTVDAAPTIHTHAAGDINSGTLGTARLGSGTASSTTFLRGDQTWATPAAPSNMVTTDTEQTISGVKTYSGLNTFKVSELRADESLRAMATGDTHSLLVQETSSTGTTALRVMLVRDKDSNGMLAISRSGPHVMWARPSATDLLEFRAFQGSSPVARVTAAGHLYGAQVYDNGNRVYSSGNAPPAPSNMVTTDTTQTISARKTLTAGAVLRAPDNLTDGLEVQSPDGSPVLRVSDKQVIVLSGSAPTTDGTQTSAQIGLRSNTRHGGGTTLQTSTLIYEAADMSTAAQAAATMRLRLTDGHLFEGSNRVYSAGNAPPAPSNMVTTDTIQSVTNTKYWTLNPGSTGALFRSNSTATSSSTLINSPTVELQGARWDGSTSVTQTAILQLVARSDTSRLTLLSADFAAPALYDNGQRVYSANNKVPVSGLNATGTASSTTFLRGDDTWATPAAPSNMVTTDSFQTITATKTFSGVVTIGGATNALDLSNPNEATSTFTTRSSRPIRFATRRWDGAASQNETVSVDAQRGSATAGNYWLNVDAPLRATELLDNGSRVFSPSNKVGTGGLSATGTADATTFLRGDNTWGTALTAAPSNMATTDTAQTISGNKDFTGTVSRSGSALVDTTDARLSDARTPTTHTHAAGDTTSGTFDLARLPVAASGTSSATQVVRADDSRLSDSRTPTTHSHAIGDLPVAASGVISSTLLARSDDARLNDPRSLISVALATTGNITLSGVQTVDGYSTTGAIILVKDQTNAAENGTYSASDTGAWSRYHTSSSSYAAQILRIRQGTVNGGTVWATSFESTDTVGTTAMRYYRVPKLDSGSSTIPPAELGTGTRDGTKYLRDDGTWTAVAGGEASGSEISATTDYTNTTPASPISGLTLFSRHRARRLPAFVGPTGQDTRVQPHIATNNTMWVKAVNGTTAPTVHGMAATWLNAGTASPAAVSVATTNLYTSMIRTRAATPAAVNGGAGVRSATAQFMVSATANMGGFHYIARWGINVGASGTRGFMGMSNQAAAYAAGTNPSAQLNQIGFYWDAAQTTLRFIASGSAAGTGVDLGANFPVTVGATNFYECSIFVPSGLGQYGFWSATRINDGAFASGTFGTSGATALTTVPLPSVLLAAHVFYGSGTLATAQSIDIQSMYIETDN